MSEALDTACYRILIVDDNPSIHDDFRKILCPEASESTRALSSIVEEVFGDARPAQPEGRFEMDSAFQGQEALAKVQAADAEGRPYSLAFVDVRMPPGWDGIETIKQIWKEHPQVQVVICTAYSDYCWTDILNHLGETDSLVILKKPFDNVEALQLAHTLTKKWAVTRKAQARLADLDEQVRTRTHELLEANHRLQAEIQQRSLVEAALRESEARFHQAFEMVAVPLAICALEDLACVDVNQSFVELTGFTKADWFGSGARTLHNVVDDGFVRDTVPALRRGERIRNQHVVVRRKDGDPRQTLASVELLKLGQQNCLLCVFQDVTEQRNLEAQLRQSQKMEAIGQLAAGVAHDFNNLLTVIHGYTSLQLAKANLESDIAKAFTQVRMASERAAALTRQLLTFSRRQVVQRKPLDLGATIGRMRSLLCRTLGETIRLDCQLAPELPLIHADESSIDQVIMNLALNARDAMPNGGTLVLSTATVALNPSDVSGQAEKRPGKFVVLSVTDNGCGMEEATLNRIFEPFFTTKPIGRGTGLGLSNVYGILKLHEGWIEVRSQVNQGSTFEVYLPVLPEGMELEASHAPVQETELSDCSRGQSILVVEDEPDVRELITSVLREKGFTVREAGSGVQAIEEWTDFASQANLLITDMIMPGGISGPMLARHLVRANPNLRVIYTSGYSSEAVANGDLLTEGTNFIAKPFSQDRLLKTVCTALRSQNAIKLLPQDEACAGTS